MAKGNTNSLWQNLIEQKWFQGLLVGLTLLLGFLIFRKIKTDSKKKGSNKQIDEVAQALINSGTYYQDPTASAVQLKIYAETLSKAFWSFQNYGWGTVVFWRWDEDEELAIRTLNYLSTPTEATLVCDLYADYNSQYETTTLTSKDQKGLSLKKDCEKFLSDSEFSRIKSVVRNSLI